MFVKRCQVGDSNSGLAKARAEGIARGYWRPGRRLRPRPTTLRPQGTGCFALQVGSSLKGKAAPYLCCHHAGIPRCFVHRICFAGGGTCGVRMLLYPHPTHSPCAFRVAAGTVVPVALAVTIGSGISGLLVLKHSMAGVLLVASFCIVLHQGLLYTALFITYYIYRTIYTAF